MENIYFKGLEKALNEGCYIKVFDCSFRFPVARVERKNPRTKRVELVAYGEGGNVLAALNVASSKIINELKHAEGVHCGLTRIDDAIVGFSLHFFKLSNGQVLSTICGEYCGEYIPVKSVITNDIRSGFELLDASLCNFNLDDPFDFSDFAVSQMAPIEKHCMTLKKTSK